MNNPNSSSSPQKTSYAIVLVIFVVTFLAGQLFLGKEQNQRYVAGLLQPVIISSCKMGLRIPTIDCPTESAIVQPNPASNAPLKQQFSELPDLASALEKLRWTGGSEINAARLITLLRTLTYSRYRESYKNNKLQNLIMDEVWKDYPDLVMASTCYYCINHSSYLGGKIPQLKKTTPRLIGATFHNPSLTATALKNSWINNSEASLAAELHSYLSAAGDSTAAQSIGDILIKNKKYEHLKFWVSNGLNGGRSLTNHDLTTIPRNIIIAAWEQGVGMAYDEIKLTSHLLSSGYRPALRFIIWHESQAYKYLKQRGWGGKFTDYSSLLKQYTQFPVQKGNDLVDYYSDNWKDIYWNKDTKKWAASN